MSAAEENFKVFGPIYNGHTTCFYDPIQAHWRLFARLDGRPSEYLAKINEDPPPPDIDLAREKVAAAVAYAFDLPPFDPETGEGLTQQAVLDLLSLFGDWLEKKNASTNSEPTSPPPTESGGPLPLGTWSASG